MSTHAHRLAASLVPPSPTLRLDHIHITTTRIIASLTSTAATSACPRCQQSATRVRGAYVRTLADLPWGGVAVHLQVRVRKFACDVPHCPQRIFTERLPDVTLPYARRTDRLTDIMRCIACTVGGAGGSRVLARLRVAASPTTLLRVTRRATLPAHSTPRVLGIDDWARRKGQTYGSILVDLEHHQVVDLLPDRTATTVATWLQQHPGVEIISRDRAEAYANGAALGAPSAVQVADRWHVLRNLGDALERVLDQQRVAIKHLFSSSTPHAAGGVAVAGHTEEPPSGRPTHRHALSQQRRAARMACYAAVKDLRQRGMTLRTIAAQVGLSQKTVQRWVHTSTFPERPVRRPRRSPLDPYKPYLLERWQGGCHNATKLWHEIRAHGYAGGCTSVRDYLARFRARNGQYTTRESRLSRANARISDRPPTPRQCVWLVLRRPDTLTQQEHAILTQLQTLPQLNAAIQFTHEFATIMRERQPEHLEAWLWRVANSDVAALRRFAAGIQRDKAAVLAGLTLEWSQGQVEGQVTRLKLVKRSTYGRAKLDLLRQRMLYGG